MIGSLIDNIIEPFAPTAALKRRAARKAIAQLRAYAVDDKGRRNKDWRAENVSADAAIINDLTLRNSRARQAIRDSWIGRSIVRSWKRNVVGRGVTPIPQIRLAGQEMRAENDLLENLFTEWADKPLFCDAETRSSFWMLQRRAVADKVATGNHFWVWNYQPRPETVGLTIRSFETEQLDQTRERWTDPETGHEHEVRNGIEIDSHGRPVAYHFNLRHPNDYLPNRQSSYEPERIPRKRVLHYYDPERAMQTLGTTELHAVLQRIRDFHRRDDAEMWAAIMEACIGLIVTRQQPLGSTYPGGLSTSATGDGTIKDTNNNPLFDMAPGMIFQGAPGETVASHTPTRPSNTYEPYSRVNLRGIGAGAGLSYEQITRDFSQGTYSSQRQGMLEDWREWDPERDMLVEQLVQPAYELFVSFAILEERIRTITHAMFAHNTRTYLAAEYVADGHEWIDPEKEVNAEAKALEQKLETRARLMTRRGLRLRQTFEQIRDEGKLAAELGVSLPENAPAQPSPFGPRPPAAAAGAFAAPQPAANGNGRLNGHN